MDFIQTQLKRANIDVSYLQKLGIISDIQLKSLVIKLYMYFCKVDRKKSLLSEISFAAEKLFISEASARDYYYHHKEVKIPPIFGINLKKVNNKVFAEYFLSHIPSQLKKTFSQPDLLPYLNETKQPLINNQIINNQIIPKKVLRNLMSNLYNHFSDY